MTEHLQCIKRAVNLSLPAIKKEFTEGMYRKRQATQRTQQQQNSHDFEVQGNKTAIEPLLVNSYITDLRQEEGLFAGVKRKFHRVFVQAVDSGKYTNVGWVLTADLDHCMVCMHAFQGLFYPEVHHCRVCGGVVCNPCSPHEEEVDEIAQAGPQRICSLCYYGQMPVNAMANDHLGVSILEGHKHALELKAATTDSSSSSSSSSSSIQNKNGRSGLLKAGATPVSLWVYGPVAIQPIHGSFVIRARRHDRSVVYINVCTCDEVPINHDVEKSRINYMLCGDCSRSSNDTDLYDVAVNPKVIDDFWHVEEKSLEKLKQDLCEQVLACLTVCRLESSFLTFSIEKSCGKYLPHKHVFNKRKSMLDMLDNARESESNEYLMISAINQSLNIMDSYDGHLAVPAKKAFRDWHYLHTSIAVASEVPSSVPPLENDLLKQLQQESLQQLQQIRTLLVNEQQKHVQENSQVQQVDPQPQHKQKGSGWKNFQVLPRPGFVIKTRIRQSGDKHLRQSFSGVGDGSNNKVFINVLHHNHIDDIAMKYAYLHHTLAQHDPLTKSVLAFGLLTTVDDKEGMPVKLLNILLGSSHFVVAEQDEHVELPVTADSSIQHILRQASTFYTLELDLDHFSLPKVRNGHKGELTADGMTFYYQDLPPHLLVTPTSPSPSKRPSQNERRGSSMAQWATELFAITGNRPRAESRGHETLSPASPVTGNRSRLPSQDTVVSNDDESTVVTSAGGASAGKNRKQVRKSLLEFVASSGHAHDGSQLITADMMLNDAKFNVTTIEANHLKQLAIDQPDILLGWQITLYQYNGDIETFVVTATRKNHLQKTEFRLSAFEKEDHWTALKRAENKSGLVFKPNRKCLDFTSTK